MTKCKFVQKPDDAYHYTMCGLDYIYLLNGYEFVDVGDGQKGVVLLDADNLHAEIARNIVLFKENIEGQDVRFLRSMMNLTQKEFASILKDNIRTIQKWESEKHTVIEPLKSGIIRILYWETVVDDIKVRETLEKVRQNRGENDVLALMETSEGWQTAA